MSTSRDLLQNWFCFSIYLSILSLNYFCYNNIPQLLTSFWKWNSKIVLQILLYFYFIELYGVCSTLSYYPILLHFPLHTYLQVSRSDRLDSVHRARCREVHYTDKRSPYGDPRNHQTNRSVPGHQGSLRRGGGEKPDRYRVWYTV